jgi:retron-type reverse transcriptase
VQLPLTVPTLEDKVLQRAVVMLLEPIYEQDFDVGSYGFRPGRSAHDALEDLWKRTMDSSGGWILEVDIRKFFDTLDHAHRREFLHLRVRDGVLKRLIGKWLKAGVMESGSVSYPEAGSPQGGVITPQTILQNFRFCFRLPCREPGFGLSMARASGGSQVARRPVM